MHYIITFLKWLWHLIFPVKTIAIAPSIKYDDVANGRISLYETRELILQHIDQRLLFADTIHSLAKTALDLFDLPVATAKADIETNAGKLLDIFRPARDLSGPDKVKGFNEIYLNIHGLPLDIKKTHEAKAKADLLTINSLLTKYREHATTKPIIEGKETPRRHKEYWMMAFYARALLKHTEITNYLTTQIDELSLKQSRPGYLEYRQTPDGTLESSLDLYGNYPYLDFVINEYKGVFILDLEKLDWEKLNPVRNKIFSHHFQSDYTQGYTEAINAEIMSDMDCEKLLDRLQEMVNRLPRIKGRAEIFQELKELFLSGKWYGFYALAMPQIEGIFAEMSQLIKPAITTSGGLPEKVNRMRKHAENAQFDFDYYEFYLPEQRNKFSHYGKDSDIELKCHYFLLDLNNLLTTCESLDTEIIQLSNMITEGPDGIRHIGDFAKLILLTDDTKRKTDFADIETDLIDLVTVHMPAEIALPAYIASLQEDYDTALGQFAIYTQYGLHRAGLAEEAFAEMPPGNVASQIDILEQIFTGTHYFCEESLKFLFDVLYTMEKLPKLFPGLPQPVLNAISAFQNSNQSSLNNIRILSRSGKFETPGDYLVSKQQHISKLDHFRAGA